MIKIFVSLILGLLIGGIIVFLSDQETINNYKQALSVVQAENAFLTEQVQRLAPQAEIASSTTKSSKSGATSLDNVDPKPSDTGFDEPENEVGPYSMMLESARVAYESGDLETAFGLYNLALYSSTDDADKEEAIEGLLAIQEDYANELRSQGEHIHMALWTLFEMHKLQPSAALTEQMTMLSSEVFSRVPEFLDADEILVAADHLNILYHTNNMTNQTVIDHNGQMVSLEEIESQLEGIQSNPDFLPRLKQRAEDFLSHSDDFLRSVAFWDYVKISELENNAVLDNPEFLSQFTDAALIHLEGLKVANQFGDIRSRLDYIRYAFPKLMEDARIQSYY